MENKDNNIVMIDPNMDLSERSPLEGMEGNSLRITEEDITDMVCETVKRVIKEISFEKSRAAFKASGEKLDNMSYHDPNYEKAHRQYKNLYTHFKDRAGENYDPNMPVIICTTQGVENLTAGELEKHYTITGYVEPSQNHIYADQKMIGYPHLKGLIGPMWDGDRLRYEDEETYHWLSI